jgi:hypothetical protein
VECWRLTVLAAVIGVVVQKRDVGVRLLRGPLMLLRLLFWVAKESARAVREEVVAHVAAAGPASAQMSQMTQMTRQNIHY